MSILRNALRDFFVKDESGTVVAEFVICMCWLCWFYVASFAVFDGFKHYNANIKATYTIGDLLSRQVIMVDDDYLDGLAGMYGFLINYRSESEVRFSSIKWSGENDRYEVHWSYSTGDRLKLRTADLPSLKEKLPNLVDGEHILLVESEATYRTLFGNATFRVGPSDGLKFNNFVVTSPRFAPRVDFAS